MSFQKANPLNILLYLTHKISFIYEFLEKLILFIFSHNPHKILIHNISTPPPFPNSNENYTAKQFWNFLLLSLTEKLATTNHI